MATKFGSEEEYHRAMEYKAQQDAEKVANMNMGKPVAPQYESMVDPLTGLLRKEYQLGPENLEGLGQIKQNAMQQGPSAWANYLTDAQRGEQATAMDAANAETSRQNADAWSQLAMRGGLGGGSRERIALAGSRDLTDARQNVQRKGATDRLNLLGQDESRKDDFLKIFAEGEGRTKQYNIDQALADKQRKHSSDLDSYKQQMEAWAANRTAQAQEKSGK